MQLKANCLFSFANIIENLSLISFLCVYSAVDWFEIDIDMKLSPKVGKQKMKQNSDFIAADMFDVIHVRLSDGVNECTQCVNIIVDTFYWSLTVKYYDIVWTRNLRVDQTFRRSNSDASHLGP